MIYDPTTHDKVPYHMVGDFSYVIVDDRRTCYYVNNAKFISVVRKASMPNTQ